MELDFPYFSHDLVQADWDILRTIESDAARKVAG